MRMMPPIMSSLGPNFSPSFEPTQHARMLQKKVTTANMMAASRIGSSAKARLNPTAHASILVANAVSRIGPNLRMSLVSTSSSLLESRINLMPMMSRMPKAIQCPNVWTNL